MSLDQFTIRPYSLSINASFLYYTWVRRRLLASSSCVQGYILPNGKDVVGTPWEMEIVDDLLIRRKRGYIYGYDSVIVLLPEMKVGE